MPLRNFSYFLLIFCSICVFQLSLSFVSSENLTSEKLDISSSRRIVLNKNVIHARMKSVEEKLRAAVRELYTKARTSNGVDNETLSFQQEGQKNGHSSDEHNNSGDDDDDDDDDNNSSGGACNDDDDEGSVCPNPQNNCIPFNAWSNLKGVLTIEDPSSLVMLYITCNYKGPTLHTYLQDKTSSAIKKVICISYNTFDPKAIAADGLLGLDGSEIAQAVVTDPDKKSFTAFIRIINAVGEIALCIQCCCNDDDDDDGENKRYFGKTSTQCKILTANTETCNNLSFEI